jgi:signal transduction histidine kinase
VAGTRDSLQDSRLPDGRFFARFVQAGVLVVGAGDELRFASPAACEVLGVEDEAALRARFPDIARQLPLSGTEGSPNAQYGLADVRAGASLSALRFEMHTVDDGDVPVRVLFVRDRTRLLPSDHVLLLASEAQANRHVLTGLVHAAKGPLNNFSLTLALLETALGRARESGPTPDLFARFERYVEVLRNESTRLAGCVENIHALTLASRDARDAIDLGALARDCAAVLRHGATMREVALDVDVPELAVVGVAERALLRLALLCAAITVIDFTAPHGRVALRVVEDGAMAVLRVVSTQPALPSALAASVFRLSCTIDPAFSAAIAARVIAEAQGGEFLLADGDQPGFALRLHTPPT